MFVVTEVRYNQGSFPYMSILLLLRAAEYHSLLFPRPNRLISSPTCQRTLSLFAVSYRVVPGLQL